MGRNHRICINGASFQAQHGELLLDAALNNGIDLPYDCRAGHCGTCCVRLVSGDVQGGEGAEPGIVHACQCRIAGEAVFERGSLPAVREVGGILSSLRRVSPSVMEVGIKTDRAFPYLAGQYAQVCFGGFPSRPYSITHPVGSESGEGLIWFHIRQMEDGHVSAALGRRIKTGHRVKLSGPYGSAYFRPNQDSRLVLVGTNTGFAPIWSIAVAALRERPDRRIMLIVGGRTLESLYMAPALVRLARFPNVRIVPVCSGPQTRSQIVLQGRPTDHLPFLLSSDVLYACGAPGMVDSVKAVAAHFGASCYADPFVRSHGGKEASGVLARALNWSARINVRPARRHAGDGARESRGQPPHAHELPEPQMGRRVDPQVA